MCSVHTRPKFGLPSQDLSTKSILPSEDADSSTDDSNENSVPECDHRTVSTNTPLVHYASPPGSPKICTEASDRFIRNELQKYMSVREKKKLSVASFLYNNARTRYDGIRCYKKNDTPPKKIDKPTLIQLPVATDVGLTKPCPPDHPKVDLSCFAAEHHRINRCLSVPVNRIRPCSRKPSSLLNSVSFRANALPISSTQTGGTDRVISRIMKAIKSPPESAKEYQRLIDDYTKLHMGRRISFPSSRKSNSGGRVWALSDLEVACPRNKLWLDKLMPRLKDAVIVAGNISSNVRQLKAALSILKKRFHTVFFCVGSKEMSVSNVNMTTNSLQKLLQVIILCDELGILMTPTLLGDDIAVVPLHGFFRGRCCGMSERAQLTALNGLRMPQEPLEYESVSEYPLLFPMGSLSKGASNPKCVWPTGIGDPMDPRNSHFPRISNFFLALNRRALAWDYGSRFVISFSAWIPDDIFCEGIHEASRDMKVGPPQLYSQIKRLKSSVHLFGSASESLVKCDCVVEGTRFVEVGMMLVVTNRMPFTFKCFTLIFRLYLALVYHQNCIPSNVLETNNLLSFQLLSVYPCVGDDAAPALQGLFKELGLQFAEAVTCRTKGLETNADSPDFPAIGSVLMNWSDAPSQNKL